MILKPPHNFNQIFLPSVFLAGSIEMGAAENWQEQVAEKLNRDNWLILNPRRDNWDSSWEQSIDNPVFRNQVEWELNGLEYSSLALFYFHPNTKAPITLMELGLAASQKTYEKVIVCCPTGFWRKGNVDIVCKRFGIHQVPNLEDLITVGVDFIDYPKNKNNL